jgi:hypothetical protein
MRRNNLQSAKVWRVRLWLTAFAQGLQEAGWTTGRNVRIDYRWGGAGADAMAKYAAELVALRRTLF